jgi:type II secretory pathway pseudopilin PulG
MLNGYSSARTRCASFSKELQQFAANRCRQAVRTMAVAMVLFASQAFAAQSHSASDERSSQEQEAPHQTISPGGTQDFKPLMESLARLQDRLEQGVQLPAARTQSKLLPLLPPTTTACLSLPNLGDSIGQASEIFHQQLQQDPVLGEWWQTKAGMASLFVDDALAKLQQFSGYLGDELMISVSGNGPAPSVLILAEVRKPGLQTFLQQTVKQYAGQGNAPVVFYTPAQLLATAKQPAHNPLVVLVRPDYMVAAADLKTLKGINTQLSHGGAGFTATPFGQRLVQAYQGSVGVLLGVNLQPVLSQIPRSGKDQAALDQSGFSDVKFLIVEGGYSGGILTSNTELDFAGPRHGIASWLAAPAALGGLDFVSPNAGLAAGAVLKNPADIFDEIKTLSANNSEAIQGIAQAEKELKINLKQDLFSKLTGQIVAAIDGPATAQKPAWKVILQASDPAGLQQMLKQAVAGVNASAKKGKSIDLKQHSENGMTWNVLQFNKGEKSDEIAYAVVDGYLVLAANETLLKEAAAIHHSGNSMAKSAALNELLPQGYTGAMSALLYEDLSQIYQSVLQQQPAEMAQMLQPFLAHGRSAVISVYAEEQTIRVAAKGGALNASAPLVLAAIAIPNLMRAKTEANQAAVVATIRTLNTAQAAYSVDYAKFAPDLAALGPGASENCGAKEISEHHACLIDNSLGNSSCTSGKWCTKGQYRYTMMSACDKGACDDYVAIATPLVDTDTRTRSFCSTSDGVVRWHAGPPLKESISADECRQWNSL